MSKSTKMAIYCGFLFVGLPSSEAWTQTRPELVVQTGHSGGINSVAFSPDGKRLATASNDAVVVLWDVATGNQFRTLKGHSSRVLSVAFSPDGKRLATASGDAVVLWDAATGEKLRTLQGHMELFKGFNSVAFSPDSKRLAAASNDFTAVVWDAQTGDQFHALQGHAKEVTSVSFSPDGQRLASGSWDGTAILWDMVRGEKLRIFQGHNRSVYSLGFSPDGKRLATGSDDMVVLWDTATGEKLRTLKGHVRLVKSVTFSPDGKRLATASGDAVVLWDAATGEKLRTLQGHMELFKGFNSVAFSPDSKRLATGSEEKMVTLWEVVSGTKLHSFQGHISDVLSASFSPDGKRLAAASSDATVVLWDAITGGELCTHQHTAWVTSVSFSPNGKRLAASSKDGTVLLWNPTTGGKLRTLRSHTDGVNSVAFSPDDKLVATASNDRTVVLWNPATGEKLHTLKEHTGWVTSVSFSPNGKRVATASSYGEVLLWDAASGNKLRTFQGPISSFSGITSVSFSPDGKRLATAGRASFLTPGQVKVWDAATGEKLRTLQSHKGNVTSVSFSPDGKHLASASDDKTAVVWDAATGTKCRPLQGHANQVHSVAFSPDSKLLVTASGDGTVALWDILVGAEVLRLISLDGGRDWLVVTPEGLFDGSVGGRNKVSYRVGKSLTVVPVDRFFKDFYRPGLLAAIFRGERPKPETDFAAQTPPRVRIASPTAGGDVDVNPVTVVVEAEDQGGGLQTPWLRHNGVRVAATDPAERKGKIVRQRFLISLVEGVNNLEGISACADGSWESEPARIDLRYARPVEKPRLFLITVGVNRYPDEALVLRFAASDAKAVHDLFRRRGVKLYRKVVPVLLADAKATRDGIRAALRKAAEEAKPQDTLLVFMAGHGTLVGQRYYYLPVDFRTNKDKSRDTAIREAGLPDDELAELIGAVPALKRVLILDTCNSGGAVALFNLRGRTVDALRGVTERMNRAQGVFVLAAAPANAEAKEPEELGHGVLTYALLAGLRATSAGPLKDEGVSPSGREPVADVLGWLGFASGNVPRLMKRYYGREQDVQMSSSGTSFPILPLRD